MLTDSELSAAPAAHPDRCTIMIASITLDSTVSCKDGFVEAEIDGEIVALDIERGSCYGLDRIATRIWRLIAEPRRVKSVCEQLTQEFQVDAPTCRSDVLDLLEDLHREGMIVVA